MYQAKYSGSNQPVRRITNSTSFVQGSKKAFLQSSSPTQRLHKQSSKHSLGTIYSSGNSSTNHYSQTQSSHQQQQHSSSTNRQS